MIAENLISVRQRIALASRRCGRQPEEVLLVAVSKTFPEEAIREASAAGQMDFGENYVQELQAKRDKLSDAPIRWHFIGHLQTNKVKFVAGTVHLIHSVDDLRLLEELQRRLDRLDRTAGVLIEIHTTDEATKYGLLPDRAVSFIREAAQFDRVRIRGLMTMGPFADDPEASRPSFRTARLLRDQIAAEGIPGVVMEHLSMGMTHDMDVAVEEGATIVRIGTAIFGTRQKHVTT